MAPTATAGSAPRVTPGGFDIHAQKHRTATYCSTRAAESRGGTGTTA
jgi:hypothetical protein